MAYKHVAFIRHTPQAKLFNQIENYPFVKFFNIRRGEKVTLLVKLTCRLFENPGRVQDQQKGDSRSNSLYYICMYLYTYLPTRFEFKWIESH